MASSMNLSTLVVVNAIQSLTVEETKDLVFQLGVPLSDLDDVTARYGGSDCKRHLIQKWLDGDTWASWAELVSGLERIKRNVLAKNIESTYIAAVPTKTNAYLSATTPFPKATIPKSSDPVALTPASIQPFSPGVKTIQLPAVNIVTRVAEVEANLKRFEDEFSDLMCDAQASLCNRESQDKHFLDRFRGYLLVLPVSKKAVHVRFFDRNEDDIIEAKTTLKLFAILCRYCNYSNYGIILHVVTKFCEATLKQRMLYYQDSLIRFEMDTTVDIYLWAIKAHPEGEICKGFTQMAMKINKPISKCTLYEIRMLRESVAENASVHSYCVYIEENIAQKSVLVSFRVHPAALEDVTSAISSDFMNVHHLTELSVNGRVVLQFGPIPTPQSPKEHISEPLLIASTTLPPPLPPKKTATEGDDQTGDSGMGTGSGSADYVLNEWRQALTHPPPEREKHVYASLRSEDRQDSEYASLLKSTAAVSLESTDEPIFGTIGVTDDVSPAFSYVSYQRSRELMPLSCVFDDLDREGAERLLHAKHYHGMYLIREGRHAGSEKVLSVFNLRLSARYRCLHYRLYNDENSRYCLTEGVTFATIPGLIEHYTCHYLPRSELHLTLPFKP